MATTELNGTPIQTCGELPSVGTQLPAFVLTDADLGDVTSASLEGRRVVLNIFPSIDTSVCAMSVRQFNQRAASLPNTTVVCVSHDLPFALGRFCAAEGIENVVTASAFRSTFGNDYGVTMVDGPLERLLARAIVIADAQGTVQHVQLVSNVADEPDYDAAVVAVHAA